MNKRIIAFLLLITTLLCLCSCSKTTGESTFSIHFIDVGQGDSALVECDGHYMLIDGGDKPAGDKVYEVLKNQVIQKLDILVATHHHADHIAGLSKALTYASSIGLTLSNSEKSDSDKDFFSEFEDELRINGSKIIVPPVGYKYSLGSAVVEVVDVCSDKNNDSLVLMVTYGDTKFLFTGDIEETAQGRISDKYSNESDKPFKIDLIKMPHHGSYKGTLCRFLRTFEPEYAIISVGSGNSFGHPDRKTLDLLDSKTKKIKVFRTDVNGDIIVRSNGNALTIETEK